MTLSDGGRQMTPSLPSISASHSHRVQLPFCRESALSHVRIGRGVRPNLRVAEGIAWHAEFHVSLPPQLNDNEKDLA